MGDKVDAQEKEEAENLIKELREALDKEDIEDIKKKKDALLEKANALASKVYEEIAKGMQEKQASETPENNTKEDNKKDDVVDAEFEEK